MFKLEKPAGRSMAMQVTFRVLRCTNAKAVLRVIIQDVALQIRYLSISYPVESGELLQGLKHRITISKGNPNK